MVDKDKEKGSPFADKYDPRFSDFPERVVFTGIGRTSLKQIHLISLALVIVGIVFAYFAYPEGLIVLVLFMLIALGYDLVFIRKSRSPVKITLYLRTNPVEAMYGEARVGAITTGAIETEMDLPNELGFRPALNRDLMIWTFDTEEDAKITARRLLQYLPRDTIP